MAVDKKTKDIIKAHLALINAGMLHVKKAELGLLSVSNAFLNDAVKGVPADPDQMLAELDAALKSLREAAGEISAYRNIVRDTRSEAVKKEYKRLSASGNGTALPRHQRDPKDVLASLIDANNKAP